MLIIDIRITLLHFLKARMLYQQYRWFHYGYTYNTNVDCAILYEQYEAIPLPLSRFRHGKLTGSWYTEDVRLICATFFSNGCKYLGYIFRKCRMLVRSWNEFWDIFFL